MARAVAWLCKEVRVQKLADTSNSSAGAGRFADLVLVRIATEARGIARSEIAADLASLASPRTPASHWRGAMDEAVEGLTGAGLITAATAGLQASEAGIAAAAAFLGVPGDLPRSWPQVRDVWLIAKALGWHRPPARRTATLATSEGLRAAVLAQAYGVQVKGAATPAQLRRALAEAALKGAFGEGTAGLAGKLRLSARAGRLLAAQFMSKPRAFGTDGQLVAALAAEGAGAAAADIASLRRALLRQCFGAPQPPARAKRAPRKVAPAPQRTGEKPVSFPPGQDALPVPTQELAPPAPAAPLPAPPTQALVPDPPAPRPPDLSGFALEVRRCAASEAQGWSGDRKAYISHVWRTMRLTRPEWGLSESEFKVLLAEAHRSGQLALANADLKDQSNIKDVQESAVVYRNAVFHFIRVDA
jgi:hypothetical protein